MTEEMNQDHANQDRYVVEVRHGVAVVLDTNGSSDRPVRMFSGPDRLMQATEACEGLNADDALRTIGGHVLTFPESRCRRAHTMIAGVRAHLDSGAPCEKLNTGGPIPSLPSLPSLADGGVPAFMMAKDAPELFLAEMHPYAAWQKRQAVRLAQIREVEEHAIRQIREAALLLADATATRKRLEKLRFHGLSGTESAQGASGVPEEGSEILRPENGSQAVHGVTSGKPLPY